MPPRARVSRSRLTSPKPDEAPVPSARPAATRKKATPRSRALSVDTLERLGARTLAELLMAAAQTDTALARSLRLALAGTDGAGRLAAEVEKRLRQRGAGIRGVGALTPAPFGVRRRGRSSGVPARACD